MRSVSSDCCLVVSFFDKRVVKMCARRRLDLDLEDLVVDLKAVGHDVHCDLCAADCEEVRIRRVEELEVSVRAVANSD